MKHRPDFQKERIAMSRAAVIVGCTVAAIFTWLWVVKPVPQKKEALTAEVMRDTVAPPVAEVRPAKARLFTTCHARPGSTGRAEIGNGALHSRSPGRNNHGGTNRKQPSRTNLC